MSKQWNPASPPMSLRESERLLKADKDWAATKDGWTVFSLLSSTFILVVLAIFGIVAFGMMLINGISH